MQYLDNNNKNSKQILHPIIVKLLEKRGITSPQAIRDFFSLDLTLISHLDQTNKNYILNDLEKATQRIVEAIINKEIIGIFGDYDADGSTSCALLYHFFRALNVQENLIMAFQPDRFQDGYGLHISSIDEATKHNIKLLITVDCGITSHASSIYAKEKNIDLIITDHHKEGDLPLPIAYAVINPNRKDEPPESPYSKLAGVGVAFILALSVKKKLEELMLTPASVLLKDELNIQNPSIYPLLQFVAVGTLADLAELNNLNVRLVRHGLIQMINSSYPCFKRFTHGMSKLAKTVFSGQISFQLGPMINAKGRLGPPQLALEFLTTSDQERANHLFMQLEQINNERKILQGKVFKSAVKNILEESGHVNNMKHLPYEDIIITYNHEWHEGVIGIVASKLVETFKVPALVFTKAKEENLLKASVRSAGELDIFELLKSFEKYFIKFGGHKSAAGLSMKRENYESFKRELTQAIKAIPKILRTKEESFDIEIDGQEITPQLARQIELLEPFGNKNLMPLFKIKNLTLESYEIFKDLHVRWIFKHKNSSTRLKGISFNYIGKFESRHPKEIFIEQNSLKDSLYVYATIQINRFNNSEILQLQVERISTSLLPDNGN